MKDLYKIISILFLLLYRAGYSQSEIYGEINYTYSKNFSVPYSENYKMTFNDSISFSIEVDIKSSKDKNISSASKEGLSNTSIVGRNNITPKYYFKNQKDFYFKDNYYDEVLIVKENQQIWDWKLDDEVKQIGTFLCNKATTNYRGRTYTAWYTKLIPLPYGPWKLNGLPGLILEAYDDDGVFQIFATKINIKNNSSIEIDFDRSELNDAMSIDDYKKKKVELIKADFAKLSSKLPKGAQAIEFNENCEDCREQVEYFNNK
jgi:GLPGLI family protein